MYNFTDLAIRLTPGSLLAFVSRNQWRSPILRRLCSYGASHFKSRTKTIPHGIGRGLRFNTGKSHSSFAFGTHKFEVQRVLAAILHPGMSYYDVGANVGFFAVLAARLLSPEGRVICFEPVPENTSQINYNARLNNAVVGFHRHITKDDHYKHTNCAACRGYLDEIRKYAKKIDKAMK